MKLKDRIKTYTHIEEELKIKNLELEETLKELKNKKSELEEIDEQIINKKSELESLKNEVIELKDFINSKFEAEFQEYDYKVNITNCYIICINGKKYITIRTKNTTRSDCYSLATGFCNVETYKYYDVLNVNDHKYKYLFEYKYGYFDNKGYFAPRFFGQKPDYEKHILEVYPELSIFTDDKVPNTYLKKIYYEVNELGGKQLIKK